MVKPLAFKGDMRVKKRKVTPTDCHAREETKPRELSNEAHEDDSWVTADSSGDISGPVVIVLPSTKPTCIACDAAGKVFTSELENMVEGDPSSAEPHDIRQVWIANQIAGTDNICFKGHHQGYLGCDSIGNLSARSEAVSPEETFFCLATSDTPGTFNIQTVREKFISVTDDGKDIRADAETISFNTTVRIRMQARFKLKLKANKEIKAKEKITKKDLEIAVGRKLEDDEVRKLKKARVKGDYHEKLLDVRVKGKHDKYS
ncbi:MAG: hypothetical protein Q9182_006573 [Xanthomendoza sp. 2 TL-2023]